MENILSSINNASLKFLEPMSIRQTVDLIVKEASHLVHADRCILHLVLQNKLNQAAVFPLRSTEIIEPRKRGFIYRAYREKKAFVIKKQEISKIHPELHGIYKSALCIPVSYHKKSIGVILLLSRGKKNFSQKDLELLMIFGSYASLAIRKALLLQDVNKALKTRDLFIALAAHEFKTPLTTIIGYIQMLEKKLSKSDGQQLEWLKNAQLETTRLNYLINELLEVDTIKKGNFSYTWGEFALTSILERALSRFRSTYPKRNISFINATKNGVDKIVCDKEKLFQAFYNLFDNAAKFSKEQKKIDVNLKAVKNKLTVTITDYGRGIDQKDLKKIFEGFHRKESDVAFGMGVGLFLAKNIIRVHKGTITIHSKPKEETTVEVFLPRIKKNIG